MGADTTGARRLRLGGLDGAVIALLLGIPALVDLPARIGVVGISGVGVLTLLEFGVTLLALLACRQYPRRLVYILAPYGAFLGWATLSPAWQPPTLGGLQNWVVYVLFGSVTLLIGTLAARHGEATERAIDRGVKWIDAIALPIWTLGLVVQGLPDESVPRLVAARSFALLGLLPLSWHLAQWQSGRHQSGVRAWMWLLAIALSLSRTVIAIGFLYLGVILVLHLRWNARALLLRVPLLAAATLVTGTVLVQATPIADRMFTGDTSLEIAGVAVNASGRLRVWERVIESARRAPFVGGGLGSSQLAAETFDGIGHPHNDYLRLWHDLGVVGLALALVAFATMLGQVFRKWRTAARHGGGAVHLAAWLALVGVLLAYVTDNAIIYAYVMTPLGVLVGASLGVRWPDDLARGPRG